MIKRDYYGLIFKYANIIDDCLQKNNINNASDLYNVMNESVEIRSVVCLHLAQIGELSNKLPDDFKKENEAIKWKALYRTRNIIAHDYGAVSYGIVADLIYSNVLPLRKILLKSIENQKSDITKQKTKNKDLER